MATERACLRITRVERVGLAVVGWLGFAAIVSYLAIAVAAIAAVVAAIFLVVVTIAFFALVVHFWRQGDTPQDAVMAEAKRLKFPPGSVQRAGGDTVLWWYRTELSGDLRSETISCEEAMNRMAAIKRQREAQDRKQDLGPNSALVESTLAAVQTLTTSEAARTGWLGDDFNFDLDINVITEKLRKAYDLQKVADRLSILRNPTSADSKILVEAKTTIEQLENAARQRVELVAKCATEAQLIDNSLKKERADARTAEQREELHAELSGMLYGLKATPETAPHHSAAADGVMARVKAYREIKDQLQLVRDETTR